MTYAPQDLLDVRDYVQGKSNGELSDNEAGIVGGPSHIATGTSYHLGRDQLKMDRNPYSARTARDKAGLQMSTKNAACAEDFDDDWPDMRRFFPWAVEECRRGAADTADIRELIYSPDGIAVLQWDRERGVTSLPRPHSDLSHRTHGHLSKYRDSVGRPLLPLFQRFYHEATQPAGGDDMFTQYGAGNGVPGGDPKVKALQLMMLEVQADLLPQFGADGGYGDETAAAVSRLLTGGDGHVYGPAEYVKLHRLNAATVAPAPAPGPMAITFTGTVSGTGTSQPAA